MGSDPIVIAPTKDGRPYPFGRDAIGPSPFGFAAYQPKLTASLPLPTANR